MEDRPDWDMDRDVRDQDSLVFLLVLPLPTVDYLTILGELEENEGVFLGCSAGHVFEEDAFRASSQENSQRFLRQICWIVGREAESKHSLVEHDHLQTDDFLWLDGTVAEGHAWALVEASKDEAVGWHDDPCAVELMKL